MLGLNLLRTVGRTPVVLHCVRSLHDRYINYYDVLGVHQHAELKEIKMAYFKMAKKFHPDTNKTLDAKQMFELVAEAYDVLSDEKKKAEYDETGQASDRFGGRSHGPGRQSTDSSYTAEQMYSRIFSSDQAAGVEEERAHEDFAISYSGSNVTREYVANVSFEEAVTGTSVLLHVRVAGVCSKCSGSRSELGYTGNVCPYCEGTGEETVRTGHIVGRKECSYCMGEKIFIKFKCLECEGIGRILYDRPYYFNIPPGSEHGQVFRVDIDNSVLGIPEDDKQRVLYVTLNVKDSPFFEREGMDLVSYVRLSPALALLGGTVEYEGLTRCCDLSIPEGTSSHTTLVIHQAGIHSFGCAGDHVLRTYIKVPKKMGWRQGQAFRRFAVLETLETGTVNGLENEMDHKFTVNVIEPDKSTNMVQSRALNNQEKLSVYETIRRDIKKKLEKWMNWQFI